MPIFHSKRKAPGTALFLVLLFVIVFLQGCRKDEGDLFSAADGFAETAEASAGAGSGVKEETEGSGEPKHTENGAEGSAETDAQESVSRPGFFIVHICGAVKTPGVYELEEGSRVMDAVEAGGGFLPEADQDSCNLAEPVTDGCQIYIMTEEEALEAGKTGKTAGIRQSGQGDGKAGTEAGLVNLNTADKTALMTLPGIGESRADDILAWRSQNGGFERIEDIMKVSGIKEGAFEKIKDKITV